MTPSEKKQILNGLITNGLRHLARGLRGFESGDYDFAVIDAFFGIEIVLKAVVFDGQWDLIFAEPRHASLQKLKDGTCKTIGYYQAVARLTNLLHRTLPPSIVHLEKLQKHRNKLVHFFHPSLATAGQKAQVATDLATAWAALRDLQEHQSMSSVFTEHGAAFTALEGRLLVLDEYLDQRATAIRADHSNPDSLSECPACKRETFDGDCALCGYSEPSHREITQGEEMIGPADCPKCGGFKCVKVSSDAARCTDASCGAWFGAIHRCECCFGFFVVSEESVVIDDEDHLGPRSYYYGCNNCEGWSKPKQ
jgi:hypothetical protein